MRQIRAYANRRLYDPLYGTYITYDDVYALLQEGEDVVVNDYDNNTDYTQKVLLGCLIRQESTAADAEPPMLTEEFLRELIRLDASDLRPLVARFLDHTVETLQRGKIRRI